MDPKHQFAAQYVLSRAAAERREREILASSSLGITRQTSFTFSPIYVNAEKRSGVALFRKKLRHYRHDADDRAVL